MITEKPDTSAFDKLSDTIDKKLLDFNLKIFVLLVSILLKPIALATEPFFRKNIGERYLTFEAILICSVLWELAGRLSGFVHELGINPVAQLFFFLHCPIFANWVSTHNYGGKIAPLVGFIYVAIAAPNLRSSKNRRRTGQTWHSLSRGESIFGYESTARDLVMAALALGILGIFAPTLGAVFLASRIMSYYLEAKQQRSLYNRYLDAMDAKVEAQHLQQALDQGDPPSDTDGLHCPLPKDLKGEPRSRVARVVSGGPFDEDAKDAAPQYAQAHQQPEVSRQSTAQPASVGREEFRSAVNMAAATATETLCSILKSKRIIRTAVIVCVVLGCIGIGIVIVKLLPARRSSPIVQPPAAASYAPPSRASPPITKDSGSPSNVQLLPNLVAATQSVLSAVSSQNLSLDAVKAREQAALEAQRQKEIEAQAALEEQKRRYEHKKEAELAEQKHQERQKLIADLTAALSEQSDQIIKFNSNSHVRLNTDTNVLAKIDRSHRIELAAKINKVHHVAFVISTNQADVQLKLLHSLQALKDDPQSDPQKFRDEEQETVSKMDKSRQKVISMLDELDTDISNAPPSKGLFNFKIK